MTILGWVTLASGGVCSLFLPAGARARLSAPRALLRAQAAGLYIWYMFVCFWQLLRRATEDVRRVRRVIASLPERVAPTPLGYPGTPGGATGSER